MEILSLSLPVFRMWVVLNYNTSCCILRGCRACIQRKTGLFKDFNRFISFIKGVIKKLMENTYYKKNTHGFQTFCTKINLNSTFHGLLFLTDPSLLFRTVSIWNKCNLPVVYLNQCLTHVTNICFVSNETNLHLFSMLI